MEARRSDRIGDAVARSLFPWIKDEVEIPVISKLSSDEFNPSVHYYYRLSQIFDSYVGQRLCFAFKPLKSGFTSSFSARTSFIPNLNPFHRHTRIFKLVHDWVQYARYPVNININWSIAYHHVPNQKNHQSDLRVLHRQEMEKLVSKLYLPYARQPLGKSHASYYYTIRRG